MGSDTMLFGIARCRPVTSCNSTTMSLRQQHHVPLPSSIEASTRLSLGPEDDGAGYMGQGMTGTGFLVSGTNGRFDVQIAAWHG